MYRIHHPRTGLDVLKVQRISQAQAWQRTGRAGRESSGFCYRVYTKMVSITALEMEKTVSKWLFLIEDYVILYAVKILNGILCDRNVSRGIIQCKENLER